MENGAGLGLGIRLKVIGKLVEETILHPTKTSRILIDPETSAISVERDGEGSTSPYPREGQ